jgi:hypothetical protein
MSVARQVMRRVLVTVALLSIWDGRQAVAEPVRIAYGDVFPPFTEFKDGKAEGLAVEIVRAAAGHAGIEVEFVAVPFDAKNLRGWTRRGRLPPHNHPRASSAIRLQRSLSGHRWRAFRTSAE